MVGEGKVGRKGDVDGDRKVNGKGDKGGNRDGDGEREREWERERAFNHFSAVYVPNPTYSICSLKAPRRYIRCFKKIPQRCIMKKRINTNKF